MPKGFAWYNGEAAPFHNQYDILCYVLSILGRAPRGAARLSHHYHLLLLGARFIALAAGSRKGEPYLASIMFVDQEEEERLSDLGGNNNRLEWADQVKSWATATRDMSSDRVKELNLILGSTLPPPKALRKMMRDARAELMKIAGLKFLNLEKWFDGDCGESHPLLSLMS